MLGLDASAVTGTEEEFALQSALQSLIQADVNYQTSELDVYRSGKSSVTIRVSNLLVEALDHEEFEAEVRICSVHPHKYILCAFPLDIMSQRLMKYVTRD